MTKYEVDLVVTITAENEERADEKVRELLETAVSPLSEAEVVAILALEDTV